MIVDIEEWLKPKYKKTDNPKIDYLRQTLRAGDRVQISERGTFTVTGVYKHLITVEVLGKNNLKYTESFNYVEVEKVFKRKE